MNVKFTTSPVLTPGSEWHASENIQTDMLLIGKFAGMKLSEGAHHMLLSSIADDEPEFTGEECEFKLVDAPANSPQKKILFFGLGRAQRFGSHILRKLAETLVDQALSAGCSKITIPVLPNRLTQGNITLSATAHIISCVARSKLEKMEGSKTLTIEFACTPQARRHLQAGVRARRRHSDCG